MAGWTRLHELLRLEIEERHEEGCLTELEPWLERLGAIGMEDLAALEALYDELEQIHTPLDLPFHEPEALEAIQNQRPNGARVMEGAELDPRLAFERIHGGWIGRAIGQTMGAPFETEPFTRHPEAREREAVQAWLEGAGEWPLEDYPGAESRAALSNLALAPEAVTREHIQAAQAGRETDLPLLTLEILEEKGRDFETADIALGWLARMPFDRLRHAEAQMAAAMIGDERFAICAREPGTLRLLRWDRQARRRNPFREWNGAQARADLYGYLNPGRPEAAAAMAWRDVRWTQSKNGLYAPMALAAMLAAAYVERDPARLLDAGLSEIPARSRLAHSLRRVLKRYRDGMGWEAEWDALREEGRASHPCHAIGNLGLVVLALLHGEGDFLRSVSLALAGGVSPRANAATVGSILGLALGRRALPPHLVQRLNNCLESRLPGAGRGTLSDPARRTAALLDLPEKTEEPPDEAEGIFPETD